MTIALDGLIDAWTPGLRHGHCSDCIHAIVYREHEEPVVKCQARDIEREIPLGAMIRRRNARGFVAAGKCWLYEASGTED